MIAVGKIWQHKKKKLRQTRLTCRNLLCNKVLNFACSTSDPAMYHTHNTINNVRANWPHQLALNIYLGSSDYIHHTNQTPFRFLFREFLQIFNEIEKNHFIFIFLLEKRTNKNDEKKTETMEMLIMQSKYQFTFNIFAIIKCR